MAILAAQNVDYCIVRVKIDPFSHAEDRLFSNV